MCALVSLSMSKMVTSYLVLVLHVVNMYIVNSYVETS